MKHLQINKTARLYGAAILLLLIALASGIAVGATHLDLTAAIRALAQGDTASPEARILLFVRLPRVLAALVCGAALAVAGAVIQGVLANSLASPSIIGVNAGAGLAVTICAACGLLGGWRLSLFAFLGAFITVMTVSIAAQKWNASRTTIILLGVAINALLGAISDTITTFLPTVSILRNDFKIGDFSSVTFARLLPAAVLILVAVLALLSLGNALDVLTLGEDSARSLGMNTGRMRLLFLLLAALLSGAAVSICGLLSFVGLLVPHAVRRLAAPRQGRLLLLCALFGAGFVALCDTLARVLFAPFELPVGILMAFLGAPFFIFILIKGKGGHRDA